ncbi:hypothetical protein PR048_017575 [Dryococelus australis]|uniref:Uncharacterized protein n=1 Tax=Dryococelus australis TaxID=614101 RepID=A0ABQ9H9W2_9NEOP|nr:hypothetical protein PR048_017575 [Dryococelus australis]
MKGHSFNEQFLEGEITEGPNLKHLALQNKLKLNMLRNMKSRKTYWNAVPSHELVTEPEKVSAPGVTEQPIGIEHEGTPASTEQIMEGEITEGPKFEAPGITEQAGIEHVTQHEEVKNLLEQLYHHMNLLQNPKRFQLQV